MKKILVIEDDSSTRVGLAGALRRHGYEVTEAADGTAGLAAAFQRPPDIILCDVNVPGPNGLEILKELRNRPETTAVPVVLMTGQPGKSGVRESMNLGADDYLAKPFSLEQMLATLAARLKRREGMQQALEAQVQAERLSAAEKLRLKRVRSTPPSTASSLPTAKAKSSGSIRLSPVSQAIPLRRSWARRHACSSRAAIPSSFMPNSGKPLPLEIPGTAS